MAKQSRTTSRRHIFLSLLIPFSHAVIPLDNTVPIQTEKVSEWEK